MMLYEQVEKREREACGGVTTVTGSCKFCGQVATRKALEEWSQEEINELATETCECVDARIYAHKKGQKERANARIDLLFGKDNKSVTVPDAAVDLLHKAVYPVCEGFIQSMTVDIGNGVKGKIERILKRAGLIIGYNLKAFDLPFMAAKGINTAVKAKICDVMLEFAPIAGEHDPERGGYKWKSLRFCADWYSYTNYKPHDALEDVRATLHCYYAMRKGGRK